MILNAFSMSPFVSTLLPKDAAALLSDQSPNQIELRAERATQKGPPPQDRKVLQRPILLSVLHSKWRGNWKVIGLEVSRVIN